MNKKRHRQTIKWHHDKGVSQRTQKKKRTEIVHVSIPKWLTKKELEQTNQQKWDRINKNNTNDKGK